MTDTAHIDFGDPRGLADLGDLRRPREPGQPRGRGAPPGARQPARHDGRGPRGDRASWATARCSGCASSRSATVRPVDMTVSIASVNDRLARRRGHAALSVPPTTVRAPWSGLTPPRDGWEPVGQLDGEVIESIAVEGISQVAEGTPANAGGHAVDALRQRTWGDDE